MIHDFNRQVLGETFACSTVPCFQSVGKSQRDSCICQRFTLKGYYHLSFDSLCKHPNYGWWHFVPSVLEKARSTEHFYVVRRPRTCLCFLKTACRFRNCDADNDSIDFVAWWSHSIRIWHWFWLLTAPLSLLLVKGVWYYSKLMSQIMRKL